MEFRNNFQELKSQIEYLSSLNKEDVTHIIKSSIYELESLNFLNEYDFDEIDVDNFNIEKLWQVHKKYIVSEINSGLVVIDQHVAHERVLYEESLQAFESKVMSSQTLLFPEEIEFSKDEYDILLEIFPYLKKIGFKRWKLIHKLGANYIAFIFAFTYLGRLTKEEFSSVEFNLLFSIIIGAFALRVLYFFRTRNEN